MTPLRRGVVCWAVLQNGSYRLTVVLSVLLVITLLVILAAFPLLPAIILAPATLAFSSSVTVALALLAAGAHRQ